MLLLVKAVPSTIVQERSVICKGIHVLCHVYIAMIYTGIYWELNVCLCRMPKLRILLVNTKVFRTTKKMVAGVRDLHVKVQT